MHDPFNIRATSVHYPIITFLFFSITVDRARKEQEVFCAYFISITILLILVCITQCYSCGHVVECNVRTADDMYNILFVALKHQDRVKHLMLWNSHDVEFTFHHCHVYFFSFFRANTFFPQINHHTVPILNLQSK